MAQVPLRLGDKVLVGWDRHDRSLWAESEYIVRISKFGGDTSSKIENIEVVDDAVWTAMEMRQAGPFLPHTHPDPLKLPPISSQTVSRNRNNSFMDWKNAGPGIRRKHLDPVVRAMLHGDDTSDRRDVPRLIGVTMPRIDGGQGMQHMWQQLVGEKWERHLNSFSDIHMILSRRRAQSTWVKSFRNDSDGWTDAETMKHFDLYAPEDDRRIYGDHEIWKLPSGRQFAEDDLNYFDLDKAEREGRLRMFRCGRMFMAPMHHDFPEVDNQMDFADEEHVVSARMMNLVHKYADKWSDKILSHEKPLSQLAMLVDRAVNLSNTSKGFIYAFFLCHRRLRMRQDNNKIKLRQRLFRAYFVAEKLQGHLSRILPDSTWFMEARRDVEKGYAYPIEDVAEELALMEDFKDNLVKHRTSNGRRTGSSHLDVEY